MSLKKEILKLSARVDNLEKYCCGRPRTSKLAVINPKEAPLPHRFSESLRGRGTILRPQVRIAQEPLPPSPPLLSGLESGRRGDSVHRPRPRVGQAGSGLRRRKKTRRPGKSRRRSRKRRTRRTRGRGRGHGGRRRKRGDRRKTRQGSRTRKKRGGRTCPPHKITPTKHILL